MTPLPPPLGSGEFAFWRLDQKPHASAWDSGEGSYRAGGRWNPRGLRVVYASLDPATTILELAVHEGFKTLDTVPHVLTRARLFDPPHVHIVQPGDLPNSNWLRPGTPSAGQQDFGAELLKTNVFVVIPSVVSNHSWNIFFVPAKAVGLYNRVRQENFALDTRLHPVTPQ